MSKQDVIILGAGAAGLMTAITAAKRGRRVLVLEHNERIGKKILISGGGRCNFTNLHVSAKDFVSSNPHFCKSALARFTPHDIITLLQKYQVPYFEKKSGQLFCESSSKEIVKILESECHENGVTILLNKNIKSVFHANEQFNVQAQTESWQAEALVIATGGLSFANLGATDFGYKIAKQFGHEVTAVSPALDGFTFSHAAQKKLAGLAGISLPVKMSCNKFSIEEDLLFTHVGLSGPAALNASLYWNAGNIVTVDFLPKLDLAAHLKKMRESRSINGSSKKLGNILCDVLPERLVRTLGESLDFLGETLPRVSDKNILILHDKFKNWQFTPTGTVGYDKAEVTRGGVSVDHISSQTLESKIVKKLYFVGEVVDVTGRLGGFNFHWAWASGQAAGKDV